MLKYYLLGKARLILSDTHILHLLIFNIYKIYITTPNYKVQPYYIKYPNYIHSVIKNSKIANIKINKKFT